MIQHTLESLSGLPDGTYSIGYDGSVHDMADTWTDGYFVGMRPLAEGDLSFPLLFGVWTDPNTGEAAFDIVKWCSNLSDAEPLGKLRNQKAIWDIANKKEIYL